jgi:hypothetical protein
MRDHTHDNRRGLEGGGGRNGTIAGAFPRTDGEGEGEGEGSAGYVGHVKITWPERDVLPIAICHVKSSSIAVTRTCVSSYHRAMSVTLFVAWPHLAARRCWTSTLASHEIVRPLMPLPTVNGDFKRERVQLRCPACRLSCGVCGMQKTVHFCPHARGSNDCGRFCRWALKPGCMLNMCTAL